jgi:hypothetical protein
MPKEIDAQTMAKAEALIDQFRQEYFKPSFTVVKNIYIDIEVLQDFRLGALLCLISTEEEYKYIKHVIGSAQSQYQLRLDDVTMKYFPAITSITDSDIDAFIADRRRHKALVKMSPMTFMFSELPNIFRTIMLRNMAVKDHSKDGVTLYIGTNSVNYDNEDLIKLCRSIIVHTPSFKIEMFNKPISEIGVPLPSYEIIFIENVKRFVEDIRHHSVLFDESLPMGDVSVFGYPLLEKQVFSDTELNKLLANTELFMNVYTKFNYIPRGISI